MTTPAHSRKPTNEDIFKLIQGMQSTQNVHKDEPTIENKKFFINLKSVYGAALLLIGFFSFAITSVMTWTNNISVLGNEIKTIKESQSRIDSIEIKVNQLTIDQKIDREEAKRFREDLRQKLNEMSEDIKHANSQVSMLSNRK